MLFIELCSAVGFKELFYCNGSVWTIFLVARQFYANNKDGLAIQCVL